MSLVVAEDLQVDNALAPLMFGVKREPLYRSSGQRVNRDVIIREDDGSEISTVSRKYVLLPHTRTLVPQVKRLIGRGWELMPKRSMHGERRPPLSIEGNGARIFVNLWKKEKTFNMGTLQKGQLVGQAFRLSTGYDCQHVLSGSAFAVVLICTNGMEGMESILPPVRIKHIGESRLQLDKLYQLEQLIDEKFKETCEETWGPLRDSIPGRERALEAIEAVTVKDRKKVIANVGARIEVATGWEIYQSVTNYLSHRLVGGTELNAKKNLTALNILLGKENADGSD